MIFVLVNRRWHHFVAVLLTLTCCKNRHELPATQQWSLYLTDSIHIRVNDQTNIQGYVQLISNGPEEYLSSYQHDGAYNYFHWYNLSTRSYAQTLKYPVDGPQGVGKVSPVMTYLSADSILLYRINSNIFYWVDTAGVQKSKLDLTNVEPGTIHVSPGYPPIVLGDVLYFFRLDAQNPYSREFLKSSKPEAFYKLESRQYGNVYPDYPDYPSGYEMSFEGWKASRCVGPGGELVYTFPFSDDIFVYKNSQQSRHHVGNTDRLKRSFDIVDPGSYEMQMQFLSITGLYTYIMYDPYRQLYYRIYLMPSELRDKAGQIIKIADYPWKLQIIDTSFRLVGEFAFQARQYNPYGVLISKRGVLISRLNPYNPAGEDHFNFSVYVPREVN